MLAHLLLLLRAFLVLAVVPDDNEDDTPDLNVEGTGDEGLDELLENVEPTKAAGEDVEDEEEPAKKKEPDEAARLRAELEAERSARRAAESRIVAEPPKPSRDPEYEREEAALADAKAKGEDTHWLEWQIDTNRKIRATTRDTARMRSDAEDALDRARFEKLEITKPKTFKRYAEKVEAALAEFRRNGQAAPPRMLVLTMLVGKDVMEGNVATKTARKATTEAAPKRPGVDRGRTPGVRSDVSAKQKQSEREARRARLENTTI